MHFAETAGDVREREREGLMESEKRVTMKLVFIFFVFSRRTKVGPIG